MQDAGLEPVRGIAREHDTEAASPKDDGGLELQRLNDLRGE
jgi:hypothetical protein